MLDGVCCYRVQDLESSCQPSSQLIAPAPPAISFPSSPEKDPAPWETNSQSQQQQAVGITNNVTTDNVSDVSVPPSDISHAASPSVRPGEATDAGAFDNGLSRPA